MARVKYTEHKRRGKAKAKNAAKAKRSKNADHGGAVKHKKRRYRPGTVSLRKVRAEQRRTRLLCLKGPFSRLVREIVRHQDISGGNDYSFQKDAYAALQYATEAYIIGLFADCQDYACYAKRVTVSRTDMKFALFKRGHDASRRLEDHQKLFPDLRTAPPKRSRRRKTAEPVQKKPRTETVVSAKAKNKKAAESPKEAAKVPESTEDHETAMSEDEKEEEEDGDTDGAVPEPDTDGDASDGSQK